MTEMVKVGPVVSTPTVAVERNPKLRTSNYDRGRFLLGDVKDFVFTAETYGYDDDSPMRFFYESGVVTQFLFRDESLDAAEVKYPDFKGLAPNGYTKYLIGFAVGIILMFVIGLIF